MQMRFLLPTCEYKPKERRLFRDQHPTADATDLDDGKDSLADSKNVNKSAPK